MDALSKLALLGTSGVPGERRRDAGAESDDPLARAVLAAFPDEPLERRVLLAAGARAIGRGAGYVPLHIEANPAAAEQGDRAVLSSRVADAISDLLEREDEVLKEALAAIARRRLELPPRLLPRALAVTDDDVRSWLRPVLGPRAKWLAGFEPRFSWILTSGASLEELERTFAEGATDAREAALIEARAIDPASARAWVEAAFAVEKADVRARFVLALQTGLSMADEKFLEKSLDDRARDVRDAAASLLARLPESAFVARMTERARAHLLDPPTHVSPRDVRDGLVAKPAGQAPRAFWLERIVASVPPSTFGEPAAFLERARKTDWADAVIGGLVFSATVARDVAWLEALAAILRGGDESSEQALHEVLAALPIDARALHLLAMIERPNAKLSIADALSTLPAPWPDRLSRRWLNVIEKKIEASASWGDAWIASLRVGARRISPAGFAALREVLLRAAGAPAWKAAAEDAFEVIRLRSVICESVPEEVP
ncbi:MAG: hypothetical protein HYV09_27175 [Deltaproteobacteria bacterium]|nr:hypothetical protein [Deltaproteobacteria bacterium]